jgi:hypothetical protein
MKTKETAMLNQRSARALLASTIAAAALLGAGCTLGPGGYLAYRVAFNEEDKPASCYPGGDIPQSTKEDKTTFLSGSTFLIYVASEEDVLLDTGDVVLTGSFLDTQYNFSGKTTDVEYTPSTVILDSDHDGIKDSDDPFIDADHDNLDDQQNDDVVDTDNDGADDRFQDNLVDANGDGEDDRQVEVPSTTKYITTVAVAIDFVADGKTISGTRTSELSLTCKGPECPPDYKASCTTSADFVGVRIEAVETDFGGSQAGNP